MPANPKEAAEPGPAREVVSTRLLAFPRAAVFTAFADPAQLARWWGPAGFRNTIGAFDFRPGGTWRVTMHAPDGTDYANESVFVEIAPPARIVFRHLDPVHAFQMAMTFAPAGASTRLTWRMTFDSAAECERVRGFVTPANEQNFDRLADHLRHHPSTPSP